MYVYMCKSVFDKAKPAGEIISRMRLPMCQSEKSKGNCFVLIEAIRYFHLVGILVAAICSACTSLARCDVGKEEIFAQVFFILILSHLSLSLNRGPADP